MVEAIVYGQETTHLLLLFSQGIRILFETWMSRRWMSWHSNVTMLMFYCAERLRRV